MSAAAIVVEPDPPSGVSIVSSPISISPAEGASIPEHHGSSLSMTSSSSANKNRSGFFSPTVRRQSKGYRDGVGTKLSIIDIRQQLKDQLVCLDTKVDTEVAIVSELQEFFKRRAEVELEYARSLDKLVKQMIQRHKEVKQHRQEQWATVSTYNCWKLLLGITRQQSQAHTTISEIYNNQMVTRLAEVIDNSQRISRKCKDIGSESHEDIMKILNELQSAMKTYHIYQSESKQAEMKLRNVESQKQKVEQQLSGKNTSSRKLKGLERQADKKQQKYHDNKVKALKARNDYLLCIEAANAAIGKYFSDDISDLMDCMDFGYHNSVGRAMMMFLNIQDHQKMKHSSFVESLNKCITDLDSKADKQKFMELNNIYFMLPKKFEYQPFKGDEVNQISAQKEVQEDLIQRFTTIEDRLNALNVENDEIWKTLETTEKMLVDTIQVGDFDVSKFFADDTAPPRSPHELAKHRSDRMETESFYLEKFREYTLSCNRLARLQSKQFSIQRALGENQDFGGSSRPPAPPPKPEKNKKRRIGHTPPVGQPRLFGGSLEEYIEATSQEIPVIIKSCIRIINLYGLHHQGVFRVPGAQVAINQFKSTFESGEDALLDVVDASEINSVAGVLKLYFRELREPLFPLHLFDALVECTTDREMLRRVERIKELLAGIPRTIFVVMRYLFAFLNHLTEYSDENMMDPYNLAICFGPTLLPIPPDRDQVTFQASVNEIVKIIIVHQEEIFPLTGGGEMYEKMILNSRQNSLENLGDGDTSSISSDEEEEDQDVVEATGVFDFDARSERELTFKRGDTLVLYRQVSHDWWEGCFQGKEGLIPDKYIVLKNSEDNKSQLSHEDDKTSSPHLMSASMTLPSSSSSKPARQASDDSGLDSLDKSLSQPNVAIRETDIIEVDTQPSPPPLPTDCDSGRIGSTSSAGSDCVNGDSSAARTTRHRDSLKVDEATITLSPTISMMEKNHQEIVEPAPPPILKPPVLPAVPSLSSSSSNSNKLSPSSTLNKTGSGGGIMMSSYISPSSILDTSSSSISPSSSFASQSTVSSFTSPGRTLDNNKDSSTVGGQIMSNTEDIADGSPIIKPPPPPVQQPIPTTTINTSKTDIISPDTTSEDLSVDIDTALEEVMAGLKSLEMQQQHDKRMSLPAVKVKQTPKHTPDLVLDLPDGNGSHSSSSDTAESDDSPTISAAETFAKSNQGTLKKAGPVARVAPMSGELSSRLSISSEPGDLARVRGELMMMGGGNKSDYSHSNPMTMSQTGSPGSTGPSSSSPLATFSITGLRKSQSSMPSKGSTIDNNSSSPYIHPHSSPSQPPPPSMNTSTPTLNNPPAPLSSSTPASSASSPVPSPFTTPPPIAQKPKPPMKVKPPVMKKPGTPLQPPAP